MAAPLWSGMSFAATLPAQNQEPVPSTLQASAWQVLGPIPRRKNGKVGSSAGMQTHLNKMRKPVPWPALQQAFPGKGKLTVPWLEVDVQDWLLAQDALTPNPRPRHGLDSGELDMAQLLPLAKADPTLAEDATVFLYRTVFASKDQSVEIELHSPQVAALWWNGDRLMEKDKKETQVASRTTLTVRAGLNHLLLEVQNTKAAPWSIELRESRPIGQERINRAIDLGVQYLLDRQSIDGRWYPYGGGYTQASTSIATYTLLACGVGRRHESVLKGLSQLRREKSPFTYSASLQLMAMVAGNDPQDREFILDLSEDLISWQLSNGLWAYGAHGDGPGPGGGDLSNTQYAALGLRAAVAAGIPVPPLTWERLTRGTLDCREGRQSSRGPVTGKHSGTPNGFGYSAGHPNAYGSMTVAGIGTLAICRDNLPTSGMKNLASTAERAIQDGIAWMGANWKLTDLGRNFLGNSRNRLWDYYYLYGIERAGVLGQADLFGEHDWYQQGAELLVDQQAPNGGWGEQVDPVTVCFALLFLKKASAQPPVTNIELEDERLKQSDLEDGLLQLRVTLRHPPAMWIDRTSEGFSQIAQVVYWMRPPGKPWIRQSVTSGRNFAIQPNLEQPGEWALRADAVLIDGSVLTSGTIDFEQRDGLTKERQAYLDEGERNQLRGSNPQPTASSSSQGSSPGYLVDNNYFTGWKCDGLDPEPNLQIKLRRSAKGSTLRLVPRVPGPLEVTPMARPTLVEVQIDSGAPVTLRIPSDPHSKAILDFGKQLSVHRIRVKILAVEGGILGEGAEVGFSEIEVL